jgi:hypothetical protein
MSDNLSTNIEFQSYCDCDNIDYQQVDKKIIHELLKNHKTHIENYKQAQLDRHNKCLEKIESIILHNNNQTYYYVCNRSFNPKYLLTMYFDQPESEVIKMFRESFHVYCDDGGHYLYRVGPQNKYSKIIASTEEENRLQLEYQIE